MIKTNKSDLEHLFAAVLALHRSGKPINESNIKNLLEAAGTPVNEGLLTRVSNFCANLQSSEGIDIDKKIREFLIPELSKRKP